MSPTYAIAMAAAQDAGNRSMRAAGRLRWSLVDWKAASAVMNALHPPSLHSRPVEFAWIPPTP